MSIVEIILLVTSITLYAMLSVVVKNWRATIDEWAESINNCGQLYDRAVDLRCENRRLEKRAAELDSENEGLAIEVLTYQKAVKELQARVAELKAAQGRVRCFPAMLPKMWTGGEVQKWIDKQLEIKT